jgi:23S rRNA (cytidine2498-2'-O)-methyltransferase
MKTLITCKEGWETILVHEAALYQGQLRAKGHGWALIEWSAALPEELCFAHYILKDPCKIGAPSVNGLTAKLLDLFTAHIKGKRIEGPWPLLFFSSVDKRLLHRAKTVEKNWLDQLQKKVSRVARLSQTDFSNSSREGNGFFVCFTRLDEAVVSFEAVGAGQKRMRMDPLAPSRSYLKIEEAFRILGCAPEKNDLVIDLGAAPGGWSYSALKRGALVTAVDNGPLKGSVGAHPNITHLKIDAFQYTCGRRPADWLLCDILEEPEAVLGLLDKWLSRNGCRFFIANLKCGRADPVLLLKRIRDPRTGIASYCRRLHVKQLYHDREEITLMGKIRLESNQPPPLIVSASPKAT